CQEQSAEGVEREGPPRTIPWGEDREGPRAFGCFGSIEVLCLDEERVVAFVQVDVLDDLFGCPVRPLAVAAFEFVLIADFVLAKVDRCRDGEVEVIPAVVEGNRPLARYVVAEEDCGVRPDSSDAPDERGKPRRYATVTAGVVAVECLATRQPDDVVVEIYVPDRFAFEAESRMPDPVTRLWNVR